MLLVDLLQVGGQRRGEADGKKTSGAGAMALSKHQRMKRKRDYF